MQRESKRLQKVLGLSDWKIDVSVGRCGGIDHMADIAVLNEYGVAVIVVDHLRHDDLDEMCDSLRHEFLHILVAPMAEYVDVVAEANSSEDFKQMLKFWSVAEEKVVARLERTNIGKAE